MTDPRIEAAARAHHAYTSASRWEQMPDSWRENQIRAMALALTAADAATKAHIVPHNIPDERMRVAKNTLYCWKGGALSDEDAIGMIVCGVANAPLKGSGNG